LISVLITAQFIDVPVETLELDKEVRLGEVAVDDPHAIERVNRCNQFISSILNGFHMPGGNESGRSYQCKTHFYQF
jgi:hypothetical protein